MALWLNAVTFYCIFLLFLIFIQLSLSFPCHCLFSLCRALQALYMAHRWMSEPCKWNKLILSPLQIAENILLISNLGSVCVEESCPRKEGHPPSPVNFGEDLYEKRNVYPLCPSQELTTALAHALIVSPWQTWPSWASHKVNMEKRQPG